MIIGVPKEIKDHEFRVGLTPEGVRTLCGAGHTVWAQAGAGEGSGFSDEDYRKAGAQLAPSAKQLFQEVELIVKVKEPQPSEYGLFRTGQTLFTYLHLAASQELTQALQKAGLTAIAYETTEGANGTLPMLTPMSEIAGRMAVQVGARYLERSAGGQGVLIGGVPGVAPASVVILGSGVVGTAAIRIAVGMGAQVTVFSVDLDQLRRVDQLYQGRVVTLAANQSWIDREVEQADLVIGAVLVRGAKTPRLVSRSLVARMKPGSVVVDVSVDQGGCIETIRPTTHSDPVYKVNDVIHYGVANMPGIVPRTSTFALTNVTLAFIVRLSSIGVERAIRSDPGLRQGVNVAGGKITCKGVADAHGLPYEPIV